MKTESELKRLLRLAENQKAAALIICGLSHMNEDVSYSMWASAVSTLNLVLEIGDNREFQNLIECGDNCGHMASIVEAIVLQTRIRWP